MMEENGTKKQDNNTHTEEQSNSGGTGTAEMGMVKPIVNEGNAVEEEQIQKEEELQKECDARDTLNAELFDSIQISSKANASQLAKHSQDSMQQTQQKNQSIHAFSPEDKFNFTSPTYDTRIQNDSQGNKTKEERNRTRKTSKKKNRPRRLSYEDEYKYDPLEVNESIIKENKSQEYKTYKTKEQEPQQTKQNSGSSNKIFTWKNLFVLLLVLLIITTIIAVCFSVKDCLEVNEKENLEKKEQNKLYTEQSSI